MPLPYRNKSMSDRLVQSGPALPDHFARSRAKEVTIAGRTDRAANYPP